MKIGHKRWIKWSLELAVLFCLLLPSLRGTNLALDGSGEDVANGTSYIVTHWHADGKQEDEKGTLNKDNPSVTIKVKQGDEEAFTGFAAAAGHEAVEEIGEKSSDLSKKQPILKISYNGDVHLVKVNLFYKSTAQEKEAGETGGAETAITQATDENGKETKKKVYNTKDEGLHTDKTAEAIDGTDGRDFQLTLESWFVGNNKANVGMVLDASGSMAFTSENLEPIQITKEKSDHITYIKDDEIDKYLTPSYTDNSKLSYSDYTYYVYDPYKETKEFAPIGYWSGEYTNLKPDFSGLPKQAQLSGYYSFNNDKERYNQAEVVRGEREREDVLQDDKKRVITAQEPEETKDGIVNTNIKNYPSTSSNEGSGYNNKYKALDLAKTYWDKEHRAALLDIQPKNDTFTISFAMKGTDSKPVVWIGKKDQNTSPAWYAIYADSEKGITKITSGKGITTAGNDRDKDAEGAKKG